MLTKGIIWINANHPRIVERRTKSENDPVFLEMVANYVLIVVIRSARFDAVIGVLNEHAFSTTSAVDYMDGIKRMHEALSQSSLEFSAKNSVILGDSKKVRDLVSGFREAQQLASSTSSRSF